MTEEALMTAYCGGDQHAFLRLLDKLGPQLHGFFMVAFRDCSLADDLLQTTLLKLHRARGDYSPDRPLRPWVFTIAARVRLDEHRKRNQRTECLDDAALARIEAGQIVGTVHDADLECESRDEQVRAAIDALPESQRVIIYLHRFEGRMTFAEIGKVLGTTEGAVKLRAFRAYARLRTKLAPLVQAARRAG